jgi:hypothetical protein
MAAGQYVLKLAAEPLCGTPLAYAAIRVLKKWNAIRDEALK